MQQLIWRSQKTPNAARREFSLTRVILIPCNNDHQHHPRGPYNAACFTNAFLLTGAIFKERERERAKVCRPGIVRRTVKKNATDDFSSEEWNKGDVSLSIIFSAVQHSVLFFVFFLLLLFFLFSF
jgi:hypothetical protein